MKMPAIAILAVTVLVSACGEDDTIPGVADDLASDTNCVNPPAAEIGAPSAIPMTLDPNPVQAGTSATLDEGDTGLSADTQTGLGLAWQCWSGSEWVDTHQLIRSAGSFTAMATPVELGATTTVPAIGFFLPLVADVLIPDVPPGIYRIEDVVPQREGTLLGHVIVEVTGN